MKKPYIVFFDLGQTLINEWDFIDWFDARLLELLNGFGARIDVRNYQAIRDSIIRDRRIGDGGLSELVTEVCDLILKKGYDRLVLQRLKDQIDNNRKGLFRLFSNTRSTLDVIGKSFDLGIIANQSADVYKILADAKIDSMFKARVISSETGLRKPQPEIFHLAMRQAGRMPNECIMVGDRLDTDICPANSIGMHATIRTMDSVFRLQVPQRECEYPDYATSSLGEVPGILEQML